MVSLLYRIRFSWGTHRPSIAALAAISRNMVAPDESGASGQVFCVASLMVSFLFGLEGHLMNPSYYALVEFIIGLALFIVVWVTVVMIYQVVFHRGVRIIEGENNLVEFI